MGIQYVAPLQRAWARMKGILFRPFELDKWVVIGFSAWLARLAGGGAGGGARLNYNARHLESLDVRRALLRAWEWLHGHPYWLALIIAGAVVLVVIGLVLAWISSRGKFIFLDNVVHNRARIVEPWRRYAKLGNSLFLWRLGYLVVCLLGFAVLAALAVLSAGGFSGLGFGSARSTTITVLAVLMATLAGIACAYVSLFLDSFVVPVMYKDGVGAIEAWRRFVPWIERNFGALVLYGLFVLALAIGVGIGVLVVGLLTCCVGLVLVALPYVGTVILLPFLVTYRAFSLEFLSQLGSDFAILPAQPPLAQPQPAQPPPPPPPQA
jgi:hypothetical protein